MGSASGSKRGGWRGWESSLDRGLTLYCGLCAAHLRGEAKVSVSLSGDVYPASDASIRQRPAGADKGVSGWPTWRSLGAGAVPGMVPARLRTRRMGPLSTVESTYQSDIHISSDWCWVDPTAFGYR